MTIAPDADQRRRLLRRGVHLEVITLARNVVGVVVLAVAAIAAASVALASFGLDSLIEIGASTVVLWELTDTFAPAASIHKLLESGRTSHVGLGIAAAAGIAGNQAVARYRRRTGRRIQSATILADAQHSWLDALSSAGALLGSDGDDEASARSTAAGTSPGRSSAIGAVRAPYATAANAASIRPCPRSSPMPGSIRFIA